MAALRLGFGLLLAALYVAIAAPLASLAKAAGWRAGQFASVGLHRLLCASLGLRWRRIGAPGPGKRLIVANHVSWLDILLIGAAEPAAFLAKREIGENSWTRWLVDLQGAVFVDRQRRRAIPDVNAEMARRLAVGEPIVLFAEATTSDGTRILPFRSSHFEAACISGAVVQPVFLHYRRLAGMPARRAEKTTVAWYGDMTFAPSLQRILACGGLACDIVYGEPFPATADRKALARRAEAAMRGLKARAMARPGAAEAQLSTNSVRGTPIA